MARVEFELVYYDITVLHISHFTTETRFINLCAYTLSTSQQMENMEK